jgi:sugar-specific transcriptional regulator TrmB
VIAESIQRQLLRRIDTLEQELERKYPRLTADAASSGKERLAQQVKRKMLENLDRSCDTTTAEIIEQIADWIAQTLRSEAGR